MERRFSGFPFLSFIFVVAIVALAGLYFLGGKEEAKPSAQEEVVDLGEGMQAVFEEKPAVLPEGVPVPNLKRVIPPGADQKMVERINLLSLALGKDPTNVGQWIDIGLWRRNIGDFEGAKEAWEYADLLRPNNSVILGNLGVVYGYDLNNVPKAEEYFLKAIKADPLYEYVYVQVYEFYRDIARDSDKARKTLEEGLKALPNSSVLKDMLGGKPAPA